MRENIKMALKRTVKYGKRNFLKETQSVDYLFVSIGILTADSNSSNEKKKKAKRQGRLILS